MKRFASTILESIVRSIPHGKGSDSVELRAHETYIQTLAFAATQLRSFVSSRSSSKTSRTIDVPIVIDPMPKMMIAPVFWNLPMRSCSTMGMGNAKSTMSVAIFCTAVSMYKTVTFKQVPRVIVRSYALATGSQWIQSIKVNTVVERATKTMVAHTETFHHFCGEICR